MLEQMPSSLLTEWMEYAKREPFGQPWENWLMAVPAHMFASVHTGKNRRPPPFDKFIYRDRESKRNEKNATFVEFLRSKAKKSQVSADGS